MRYSISNTKPELNPDECCIKGDARGDAVPEPEVFWARNMRDVSLCATMIGKL